MTEDATWMRITACANIPVREGRVTVVRGRHIAIFNVGDRFLAVENRCPHRGGPLVATFPTRVADGIVELQIPSYDSEQEPLPDHRDRPIRWVQRKPSPPISTPPGVL